MGSQFVDLNADGTLDYLTATFDGSPHIAYGSKKGFLAPVHLHDVEGRRIVISSIWDPEQQKHTEVDYATAGKKATGQRLISTLAFDWDADGDFDLLLGSYALGRLYLMKNVGTKSAPKFQGPIEPVLAGGVPFELPAKMTTPRLVDWDKDGDLDLLAGTFGDTLGQKGETGGIYLALNRGKRGAPSFDQLQPIIAPVPKGGSEPTRADSGLYPEPYDIDGDGDLDLLVGAYSHWTTQPPELTAAQTSQLEALQKRQQLAEERRKDVSDRRLKATEKALEGVGEDEKARRTKIQEVYRTFGEEWRLAMEEWNAVNEELKPLTGAPERRGFIWLYERL